MKLKVYQQGGGLIYTPFIPGTGQTTVSGTSGSSSGEDDSKIDPLDKEILALMKDNNLLPSDIQMIYKKLIAFQKKTQGLSAMGLDGYRSVMPGMLQIMQMVSIAKNNKERFDASAQLMTEREAGGELALDSMGAMWVMDNETGKVSKVMPNNFDRQKYTPLSNSQVLDLRRSHPELAFDVNSFETVGNNIIGMKQVQNEIADIVKKFGNEKNSQYVPGAIQDLAKQVAENGYFKVTVDATRSLSDLNHFTELLWEGLGNNVRNLLSARAAISPGYNNPLDYLRDMIFAYSNQSVDKDFDANMTKAGGGAGSGSGDEKLNDHDTFPERLSAGQGVVAEWDYIMPGNTGNKLWTYVQNYGGPGDNQDDPIGTVSMKVFLENFNSSRMCDWNNATLGDQPITTVDFPKIMFKGGSTMKRVVMPIKQDGSIDFKTQQEVANLKNWIDEEGILNETLIKERVSEIDDAYWDSEKKVICFKRSKPFLALDVITSSDKVRIDPNSPYVYNMDKGPSDIRKDWLNTYEEVLENGYEGKSKEKKYDFGKTRGRHLYETVMFVPLISESLAATIYHNQNVPKSRYEDIGNQAEANQRAKREIKGNYAE